MPRLQRRKTNHRPAPPTRRILVLLMDGVHLQDLAGPVQVFDEAAQLGGAYSLHYIAARRQVRCAQGLSFSQVAPLTDATPDDLVLIPGISSTKLDRIDRAAIAWTRRAHAAGARVASICSGAFVLARAGLLDGRRCTTHWKITARLRAEHPTARVLEDVLFVDDGDVITSAGVAAGIDLALALVERDHGPLVAARVAREMVVYVRRAGDHAQRSVYMDHRTHLHPGVHRVQDFLIAHPERKPTLAELARLAAMSPRNLARVFRRATAITPKQFAARVKLQVARDLAADPQRTVEEIAGSCGFDDARQLRRLWRRAFGGSISEQRGRERARTTERLDGRALNALEQHTARLLHSIGGRAGELAHLFGVSERTVESSLRR